MPPSTASSLPVTKLESSEASRTHQQQHDGLLARPAGVDSHQQAQSDQHQDGDELYVQNLPANSPSAQLELGPAPIDWKFGAGRESRVERKEEDGLGDFLRRAPALHR